MITLKHIIVELIFLNIHSVLVPLSNGTDWTTPYIIQNPTIFLSPHYEILVDQCLNLHLTFTTLWE